MVRVRTVSALLLVLVSCERVMSGLVRVGLG